MRVTYGAGFFPSTAKPMRSKVEALQDAMIELPQVDCPIKHFFAPGLYAREITIPAGTVVTGAVHKTENIIVVSMGLLQVVTETGTQLVKAGDTIICKVGMKNAVYALEDSRWTNFLANPTNETDANKLVEIFTESKATDLLGGSTNLQLAANKAAELIEA